MRRRAEKSQNASYVHPFIDGSRFLLGVGEKPRTLCELAMNRLSAELRSQREWWKYYQDPETRRRRLNESISKTWKVGPDANNIEAGLAKHQIDYVLDELAGYAALRDDIDGVEVSCFDRIWQSEHLLNESERNSLIQQLERLHRPAQPSSRQDILVNPFRYCYVHGKTLLRRPEEFESFVDQLDASSTSLKYSALPSLVNVHVDHPRAFYGSYINDVDPSLSELCASLQTTLGRSIKLFEKVLTSLHRSNPLPQRIQGTYHYRVWDEPEPPEDDSDEEALQAHSRELREWSLYRPIEIPDIPENGYQINTLRFAHEVRFRENQTIQALAQALSFTAKDSDRPKVKDAEWHVEGMANEQISVCCFHFLSVEGIDNACISFRMATTSPSDFLPHDVGATLRTWGLQSGDECNQVIGSVPLRTGLSLAFPNIYQHRIQGVNLRKGYEKGRLTILEFYLVDPDVPPIVSTADVAPQQRGWILRALGESVDPRIPPEVLEKIVDMVENVFSEEEADKYRLGMEREREVFRQVNDRHYFCLPFSMDDI